MRIRVSTYYCLVDSAAQVNQLGAFFAERGQRLQVLLELGVKGGRTGMRNEEQLQCRAGRVAALAPIHRSLRREMYEGVLDDEAPIREFLDRAVALTRDAAGAKRLSAHAGLLSGAGSAWYDVVAEDFSAAGFADAVEIVLRPGCYLTPRCWRLSQGTGEDAANQ